MTIWLGNSLGAREHRPAWAAMLLGVRTVTVVPYAVRPGRRDAMRWWCWSSVRRSGSPARVVLGDPDPTRTGRDHLVLLPGGNTYELLDELRARDGITALRDVVAEGGHVYGGSAGALVLGRSIAAAACFDEDTVGTRDPQGADLLGGLSVAAHWEPRWDPQLHDLAAAVHGTGGEIALPDRAMVVLRRGRLTSLGRRRVRVTPPGAAEPVWLSTGQSLPCPGATATPS